MMTKKLSLLLTLLALLPTPSLAVGIDILGDITKTGEALYGSDAQPVDPKIIISNLVRLVLGFLGFILIILLLYSGFRWMTSDGNEKTIEAAKGTIRSSIIGLIIVLLAYAIASFVTTSLQEAVNL